VVSLLHRPVESTVESSSSLVAEAVTGHSFAAAQREGQVPDCSGQPPSEKFNASSRQQLTLSAKTHMAATRLKRSSGSVNRTAAPGRGCV